MSSSKDYTGSVPKTMSVGRQSRSLIIFVTKSSSIRGRLSAHLVKLCLIANDLFFYVFIYFIFFFELYVESFPLAYGLYAVVLTCFAPSKLLNS